MPQPGQDDADSRLLIVGASTRAAAFSARRAGFQPICCDLFADADTCMAAEVRAVPDYPSGILSAAEGYAGVPCVYVGALENSPAILEQLAARRPLLGIRGAALAAVRDPFRLAEALGEIRAPTLGLRSADHPPPRDGSWLIKPLRSAAGRRIAEWTDDAPTLEEPYYFQQRAAGRPYSALFVAPPDRRDVRFVGIARHLAGATELHAAPFAWCGSLGPETLPVGVEHLVRRIGNFLSWRMELCGLYGIDFIVDEKQTPWLTEVNPRYTGSTEVLEHALGLTLLRDHCAAFGRELPALAAPPPGTPALGKFILYSDREFVAPDPAEWLLPDEWLHADCWRGTPRIADIPAAGATIRCGDPVCSLFTAAATASDCLQQLPSAVADIRSRLLA
jgi:predicted ATP-grasp superfamily ATP-dependent carboligase